MNKNQACTHVTNEQAPRYKIKTLQHFSTSWDGLFSDLFASPSFVDCGSF